MDKTVESGGGEGWQLPIFTASLLEAPLYRTKLLHMPTLAFERISRKGFYTTDGPSVKRKLGRLFHNDDQLGSGERISAEGQEAMIC